MINRDIMEVIVPSTDLEKRLLSTKGIDNDTKKLLISLFKDFRTLARLQIPQQPIEVSDDGHEFKCPTCGTVFQVEDFTTENFYFCGVCGQKLKDNQILLDALNYQKDLEVMNDD